MLDQTRERGSGDIKLLPLAIMESSREDLSRVTVEATADFERVKAAYTEVYLSTLDAEIRAQGLEASRDALIANAKHVGFSWSQSVNHSHSMQTIDKSFELIQPNVRINGQQYDPGQGGNVAVGSLEGLMQTHRASRDGAL